MIIPMNDKMPSINENSYVAENTSIIGNVEIHEEASVWFGTVLRGDVNSITVGSGSNIQDNCTVHVNEGDDKVEIGERVTVGHNVVLHGCRICDDVLIGMGSIILDGAEIGNSTIVGAGSLVTSNKKIPQGVLCMGSPAKVIRELTAEEKMSIREAAEHYIQMSKTYKKLSDK